MQGEVLLAMSLTKASKEELFCTVVKFKQHLQRVLSSDLRLYNNDVYLDFKLSTLAFRLWWESKFTHPPAHLWCSAWQASRSYDNYVIIAEGFEDGAQLNPHRPQTNQSAVGYWSNEL